MQKCIYSISSLFIVQFHTFKRSFNDSCHIADCFLAVGFVFFFYPVNEHTGNGFGIELGGKFLEIGINVQPKF